ncbi:hypothetical protein KSB_75360 [Ktedonobacter robiniae]|uniref:Uncharacterized protein n=1 Tax=Ktedonobacter robiniae TaxID=2778365 RepID=A0ABQ3V1M9_9CHLR|nr:hypothetical protein KSB_75360 [Ktedonobacter robiniae]
MLRPVDVQPVIKHAMACCSSIEQTSTQQEAGKATLCQAKESQQTSTHQGPKALPLRYIRGLIRSSLQYIAYIAYIDYGPIARLL